MLMKVSLDERDELSVLGGMHYCLLIARTAMYVCHI